jgi:hypothetical protein
MKNESWIGESLSQIPHIPRTKNPCHNPFGEFIAGIIREKKENMDFREWCADTLKDLKANEKPI